MCQLHIYSSQLLPLFNNYLLEFSHCFCSCTEWWPEATLRSFAVCYYCICTTSSPDFTPWYEIPVTFLNSWGVSSQSHPWIPHFNIKPRDQDLLSSWWTAWWGFCCCFGYFGVCCILNVALVGLDYVVAFSYPLAMYPAHNWTQINGPVALHYN